jgi:endogenous inhibitor of DNA gyrase (YacG/DUF329 family)
MLADDGPPCPVCGGQVWRRTDRKGYPKTYCDAACRRVADRERRIERYRRRKDAEALLVGAQSTGELPF